MKPKMPSSDCVALERLRDSVVRARRWHHAEIQRLDAAWSGVPAEIAASAPSQRAVRLEIARRVIAKLTASVPASVFSPEADPAAPPVTTEDAGQQLAT